MRIVSWNVNGLRSLAKNDYLETFIKDIRPDIFCLQETKASPEQLTDALRQPGGYTSFFSSSQVRKGYSGVAIYSKSEPLSVVYGMGIKEFDQEGRITGAEYENFWLFNVYFPNGSAGPERLDYKLRFYDAFLSFINRQSKQKPVIFCGDVNTAHEEIDLTRPEAKEENSGFLPQERAWIDEIISAGYADTFRHLHPHQSEAYTYWDMQTRARDRNVGWRLDYFFMANELLRKLKKAEIHNQVYGSDHCPISVTL